MVVTDDVTVVMATRNRRDAALGSLDRLRSLPERPNVIVVDNASTDGTAGAVQRAYPSVTVVRVDRNLGAAGRNIGARHARTRFVAFSDDDSWWAPRSLARAAHLLDAHPTLGLVAARVLVGPEQRFDPVCLALARSPLEHRHPDLPGSAVLGFLACAAVVRRDAFLDTGGFPTRFGLGGEEELVSIDLASAGWDLAYVDDVVAHHHPSSAHARDGRRSAQIRNAIWTAWLRLPTAAAVRRTARLVDLRDPAAIGAMVAAARGLPWVARHRRVAAPDVVAALELLDRAHPVAHPGTGHHPRRT